jgi:hypothetical protein
VQALGFGAGRAAAASTTALISPGIWLAGDGAPARAGVLAALQSAPAGAPVFDAEGALAGLVLGPPRQAARIGAATVPVRHDVEALAPFRAELQAALPAPAGDGPTAPAARLADAAVHLAPIACGS